MISEKKGDGDDDSNDSFFSSSSDSDSASPGEEEDNKDEPTSQSEEASREEQEKDGTDAANEEQNPDSSINKAADHENSSHRDTLVGGDEDDYEMEFESPSRSEGRSVEEPKKEDTEKTESKKDEENIGTSVLPAESTGDPNAPKKSILRKSESGKDGDPSAEGKRGSSQGRRLSFAVAGSVQKSERGSQRVTPSAAARAEAEAESGGTKSKPSTSVGEAIASSRASMGVQFEKKDDVGSKKPNLPSTLPTTQLLKNAAPTALTRPKLRYPYPKVPEPGFRPIPVPHRSSEAGRFEYPPPYLFGMQNIKRPLIKFKQNKKKGEEDGPKDFDKIM